MPDLTPDAACDAFRAISNLAIWTKRRFAAYVREHLPRQKKLIAHLQGTAPEPDSKEARIPRIVEDLFYKVLRLKVEKGLLPASGPAVTVDDLYRFAGILVAPFVWDMEAGGVLEPGSAERAKKWRAKGLSLTSGVFERAVKQALEEAGTPGFAVAAVAPLVAVAIASQDCLRFPSSKGSPEAELIRISGHLAVIRQKHGLPFGKVLDDDELMRELMARITDRKEYEYAIDACLFAAGDAQMDELDDAAKAAMRAVIAIDGEAEPDLQRAIAQLGKLRTDDRIMRIAYGAFMRKEADAIWSKTARPA